MRRQPVTSPPSPAKRGRRRAFCSRSKVACGRNGGAGERVARGLSRVALAPGAHRDRASSVSYGACGRAHIDRGDSHRHGPVASVGCLATRTKGSPNGGRRVAYGEHITAVRPKRRTSKSDDERRSGAIDFASDPAAWYVLRLSPVAPRAGPARPREPADAGRVGLKTCALAFARLRRREVDAATERPASTAGGAPASRTT